MAANACSSGDSAHRVAPKRKAKSEGAGWPLTYADDPADNVTNVVRSTFSRKRA